MTTPPMPLTPDGRILRLCFLVLMGLLTLSTLFSPGFPTLPKTDLMQQLVGLPCPFCGGTRAMHCLLMGNWQRALYFNWLAFPSLLGAVIFGSVVSWELIQNRRILRPFKFPARAPLFLVIGLAATWTWQVYQALATPKPELLNPNGLFFQFVSFPEKRYIAAVKEHAPENVHASNENNKTAH